MATSNVPAKLKTPDLAPFILRASQLEKAKPVIAYWCEYWIVNQILSKGLHNSDAECLQYTTTLMDKLEQIKSENSANDAIVDDTAGQAYVEQFGLETFTRADRAVQANKVTRQTADTFQAAATIFELVNIWGQPDAETLTKIKFAKWNAIRILKAVREGKDPNESNPKPDPAQEENLPALDPNDPEVQNFVEPTKPRQASVEEVPDEQDRVEAQLARQSILDHSLHPSAQVSARASPGPQPPKSEGFDPYPRDGFPYNAVQDYQVSPLEPSPKDRNSSVGGGYFPEVPTLTSESQDATLPTASPDNTLNLGLPHTPMPPPAVDIPKDFQSFPPPPVDDQPSVPATQDYYQQTLPPPPLQQHGHFPPVQPTYQPAPQQYNPPAAPVPAPVPAAAQFSNQKQIVDDVAIAKAQKHAKWAISALNFEDTETAVKELRAALQTLGAQ